MSELYDTDILVWSEKQSALLRRRAAGELVNECDLDWTNLAEEIGDVGSNRLHAVESLLVQAMAHRLKAIGWPDARDVENWLADARGFSGDAGRQFVLSMRQRIDIDRLYRHALRRLPARMDDKPPIALPDACPWSLDKLLAEAD